VGCRPDDALLVHDAGNGYLSGSHWNTTKGLIMIAHYFGDNLPYYLGFLAVVVVGIVAIYFSRNTDN
jgi:hypothetical protein